MKIKYSVKSSKIKVSDYIAKYLADRGTVRGYFMIGGMLGHIADSCSLNGIELYTMHHEQAAAFAAEADAATTGKVGLAMGTSGPGATNLITGIASAYFASYPVLFITGQVNTYESNTTKKRRQVGFQELDIITVANSLTKYSVQVKNPKRIAYELEKAMFIAQEGRMGPVLLDLPFNIQRAEIELDKVSHFIGSKEYNNLANVNSVSEKIIRIVAKELHNSKRPIILIGHGVKLSNAEEAVNELITKTGIPFVTSLLGLDAVPGTHRFCYGFIGTYGQRYANFALANSDLILVLGARLDSRQVGVQSENFAPESKIIHIDIDENELGKSVKEWMSIISDIGKFVKKLLPYMTKELEIYKWHSYLENLKTKYGKVEQVIKKNEIDPITVINLLSEKARERSIVTVDVGSNQIWFAQGWKSKKDQTILIDGGMAPMGCSLPYAIGASLANMKQEVLTITGDGGLQVNIHELQTVVRNRLPIKIVVLNNNALGMLTQFQSENFGSRMIGSIPSGGYNSPNFVKVANAYGIPAISVSEVGKLEAKIDWLLQKKGPALLDIKIPVSYWTLPKSKYNEPVHKMFPLLSDQKYKEALKYISK